MMTCECYYGECQHHASQSNPDEGPFCDEPKCLATEEQLVVFQRNRAEYLKEIQNEASNS